MIWMSITALSFANIVNGQLEPDFPATVGLGAGLDSTHFLHVQTLVRPYRIGSLWRRFATRFNYRRLSSVLQCTGR